VTTAELARAPQSVVAATRPPFDRVTIAVHWTTVALVLGLFAVALAMSQVQDEAGAKALLTLHRSLGVTVWTLTVLRLVWRLTRASLPPFPESMGAPHRLAARLSEYGLYLFLLAQPVTGMIQSLYRGKAFDLFYLWRVPAVVGRDRALVHLFHAIHEGSGWAFAALIGLHASAALIHRFVLRDGVFESMWRFGRRPNRRGDPNP
jgi:cytochrome b561